MEHWSSRLKTGPACSGGRSVTDLRAYAGGQGSLEDFSQNKRARRCHLPLPPPSQDTQKPMGNKHGVNNLQTIFTLLGNNLHPVLPTPNPCTLLRTCPLLPPSWPQQISGAASGPLPWWTGPCQRCAPHSHALLQTHPLRLGPPLGVVLVHCRSPGAVDQQGPCWHRGPHPGVLL